MTSAFIQDELGALIYADPESDLDYSITSWLEGLIFLSAAWSISPTGSGEVIYNDSINVGDVVIDGVTYAAGKVASTWIKGLNEGVEYTVTLHATFTGNRIDDRTFRIRCKSK